MADGRCRIAGDELVECIDLGDQYVSDFVSRGAVLAGDRSSLRVGISPKSGLAQLYDSYPPEKMYRRYWYQSGINESMRAELRDVVESCRSYVALKPGDTVLDIASNDGTLLEFYPPEMNRIGVDPSDVARNSPLYGERRITLLNDFFSAGSFGALHAGPPRIVTVIAMFYDLEDPAWFLRQVREIIDEQGLLVIQMSYTPLMLAQNEFGFVSHEHVCYYTLEVLNRLLVESGFQVIDVRLNPTNGGSFRVYAVPEGGIEGLSCPLNWLSIGEFRFRSTLEQEKKEELGSPAPFLAFMRRITRLREETLAWLRQRKAEGKKVIGYGASTKGNVLLQYYGLTPELLPMIAERSESKWGLYTVGTGIPIISEEEMRRMRPDYLFVLPWFFITSFLQRESDLLSRGTRFVLPQPELRVVP